jgi:adenylate cyclase
VKLTLRQVLLVAIVAVAAVVAGAYSYFTRTARASILASAERQRAEEADEVELEVRHELQRASHTLDRIDTSVWTGAFGVEAPAALEPLFYALMVDEYRLEEITFTHAQLEGWDDKGEAKLGAEGRWQISVYKTADGAIDTRVVKSEGNAFAATVRKRADNNRFASGAADPSATATDPTLHYTFSVVATEKLRGQTVWSDLHWSEADQALPIGQRRVVLTVQKTINDAFGKFAGVLRVGLRTHQLDKIIKFFDDAKAERRVALVATTTNPKGLALLARVDPSDEVAEVGDDLRIATKKMPAALGALFASPIAQGLDPDAPKGGGTLVVGGEPWLATLRPVELGRGGTRGWAVAVLVPESAYTKELAEFQRMMVLASGATLAVILLIAGITFLTVRRGLARVAQSTTRMRKFDFAKVENRSAIREVDDVMTGLERAKTVVRAMGKYIPIDLVRRLYASNEEPRLGGDLADVSLMFTDIEGFTTLSEKLTPDELARRLGDYLEAMTSAIEAESGTIDKYIGDAVMAIWNAPQEVKDHPKRACAAALACMKATGRLYASPAWEGLPALTTRYGIHRASVMVGHFGAASRLSYTALGDGVNLAARLEPLCKQYGIIALASEAVVKEAQGAFAFRRIDRVAVKGKTEGIDVFELLGESGAETETTTRYEEALEAYLDRRFADAIAILEPQAESDGPSEVLLERCRAYVESPPPDEWNGVYVATSK